MRNIRILQKRVQDKGFKEVIIPNRLESFQNLVGGPIETVTVATDCVVICNEEGRLQDLECNCSYMGIDFVGPILIVGVDGEEFTDSPWSVTMANKGIEG